MEHSFRHPEQNQKNIISTGLRPCGADRCCFSGATKSSKCNRGIKENFSRRFPAQAFSWTRINQVDHFLKFILGQTAEVIAFWVEEAQDIVCVFIGAALPWFIELGKINGGLQIHFKKLEFRKLGTIVQRDTKAGQLICNRPKRARSVQRGQEEQNGSKGAGVFGVQNSHKTIWRYRYREERRCRRRSCHCEAGSGYK